jgi:hypothetical protein
MSTEKEKWLKQQAEKYPKRLKAWRDLVRESNGTTPEIVRKAKRLAGFSIWGGFFQTDVRYDTDEEGNPFQEGFEESQKIFKSTFGIDSKDQKQ